MGGECLSGDSGQLPIAETNIPQNFCWGLGQVIGVGVVKSMINRTDEWAYRIPYSLQCEAIDSSHHSQCPD